MVFETRPFPSTEASMRRIFAVVFHRHLGHLHLHSIFQPQPDPKSSRVHHRTMNADTASHPRTPPSVNPANHDLKSSTTFIHVIPIVVVPLPNLARMHIPNTDIPEKFFSKSIQSMNLRRRSLDEKQVRRLVITKASLKRRKTQHSYESDTLDADLDTDFEDSDEF